MFAGIAAPVFHARSGIGIRGIGSVYYLAYAINHDLPPELAHTLTALTLTAVAVSVAAQGITVTPLMSLYSKGRPETPSANALDYSRRAP